MRREGVQCPRVADRQPMPGRHSALVWGVFIACSWTWCIGMYLPILLIRDLGWLSFAAFAIPNCVGAAAFGWAVLTRARSRSLVLVHAPAMRWFAGVTAAFQVFFVVWMVRHSGTAASVAAFLGLLAALLVGNVARGSVGGDALPRAGSVVVVFLASLLCALAYWAWAPMAPTRAWPTDAGALAYLAPVCAFGFVLCPYLDPTFHEACAGAWTGGGARGSRAAFTLGFLVFFPLMIGFTLLYAPALLGNAERGLMGSAAPALGSAAVGFHIAMQGTLTFTLHRPHIAPAPAVGRRASVAPGLGQILIVMLLVVVVAPLSPRNFEIGYRLFMSFYALVFPAYVWICVLPTFRAPASPTGRQWALMALAVLLAGPFFWLGFIELRYWALAPGLLIVLLARVPVGRTGAIPVPG